MTEARLTRSRARTTDTPLTAPLPYGAAKSRTKGFKDLSATRTALFNLTNDTSNTADPVPAAGTKSVDEAGDVSSVTVCDGTKYLAPQAASPTFTAQPTPDREAGDVVSVTVCDSTEPKDLAPQAASHAAIIAQPTSDKEVVDKSENLPPVETQEPVSHLTLASPQTIQTVVETNACLSACQTADEAAADTTEPVSDPDLNELLDTQSIEEAAARTTEPVSDPDLVELLDTQSSEEAAAKATEPVSDPDLNELLETESFEEIFDHDIPELMSYAEPSPDTPTQECSSDFPQKAPEMQAPEEETSFPTPQPEGERWAMQGSATKPLPEAHVIEYSGATAAAASATRLASKVFVPQPATYDPRSLRQLRKEIKEAKLQAQPASPADSTSSSLYTDVHLPVKSSAQAQEEEVISKLTDALGGMRVATDSPQPLRGLPVREGQHIRFDEDGTPEASPGREKTLLRGVPVPRGQHVRFD